MILEKGDFEHGNEAKADMAHIYDEDAPTDYFRELYKLDYAVPGHAKPIFDRLIESLIEERGSPLRLLDVGCSYGVNSALLKHDLDMPDLYRYRFSEAGMAANPEQDKARFEDGGTRDDIAIIGLDPATQALDYARRAGLLDATIAADLESEPLSPEAERIIAPVDLMISTGCVGYIGERSFEKLMPSLAGGERPAWIANFVLRMFPFDQIADTLSRWDYTTEKLDDRYFPQRLFSDPDEKTTVLSRLETAGIDTSALESDGKIYAEFFLSRPTEDVKREPLEELLAI